MGASASNLPAFVVVLPALCGMAMLVVPRAALRVLPPVAGLATAALAFGLAWTVGSAGPVEAVLGGWAPPLGILLRADGLAAILLLMAAAVAAAVALTAIGEGGGGGAIASPRVFWALLFLLWAGLNTAFLSRDLFNLYVALEVTGLGGVTMVALAGGAAALRAQMRYLIYATVGSLLYLLGVALIYAELGALDIDTVADRIRTSPPALAAAVLMTLGLLVKTAIWPLHVWLPPAHSSAPPAVSAVLSGLVVKASLCVLIRLWFEILPGIVAPAAWTLLGVLGAVAVLWGSLLALRQERLKLMVAYSTVAQLGYMMLVFPLAAPGSPFALQAWTGSILQVASHGVAKAAMFLAAGSLIAALGGDDRSRLAGGTRRMPVPVFAIAIAGLSITALPPSGGFLAKWLLLRSAIGSGEWALALVLFAGGLMAAAYVLRFLLPAFRPVPDGVSGERLPVGPLGHAAFLLALLSLAMGIAAEPLIALIEAGHPGGGRGAG